MKQELVNEAKCVIANFVKEKRTELGWTVNKVAQLSGLTGDQVKGIEAGDKSYTIDSFIRLLSAYDIRLIFTPKDGDLVEYIKNMIK